jgi:hyperosmotically inducible periplasmic protein
MSRGLLVIVLLLIVGFVAFQYSNDAPWLRSDAPWLRSMRAPGVAHETENGLQAVGNAVDDAAITAKIKAKMALDDSVRALSVDVSTTGTTVTLSGTVRSTAERDRAVALARETQGVTRVVDHLVLASR